MRKRKRKRDKENNGDSRRVVQISIEDNSPKAANDKKKTKKLRKGKVKKVKNNHDLDDPSNIDGFDELNEVINSSFADCGKDDPETYNEMKKDLVALLSEEISLHENVTTDTLQRTKVLIMGAKRTSSHYQKEAEKCNAGMETCEGARERAEVQLIEERKLTALWLRRAHEYGWKDGTNDFL